MILPNEINRRLYFRFETNQPIVFQMIEMNGCELKVLSRMECPGIIKNLSASGLCIESGFFFNYGTLISLKLPIGFEKVDVIGRVVRLEKTSANTYRAGIQFLGIDERERKLILNYINKETIKKNKKR